MRKIKKEEKKKNKISSIQNKVASPKKNSQNMFVPSNKFNAYDFLQLQGIIGNQKVGQFVKNSFQSSQKNIIHSTNNAVKASKTIQKQKFIIEDNDDARQENQIQKSKFLSILQDAIKSTVEDILKGTSQTADNCPYIKYWFNYYQDKESSYIERSIQKYIPDTSGISSWQDYLSLITKRVRKGFETFLKSGTVTEIPDDIPKNIDESGDGKILNKSMVQLKDGYENNKDSGFFTTGIMQKCGSSEESQSHTPIIDLDSIVGHYSTGIIPLSERPYIECTMGQGVEADLRKFILYSDQFSSCSPVVMFNENTSIAGLFHYGAGDEKQLPQLKQMFDSIKPTFIGIENRKEYNEQIDKKNGFMTHAHYPDDYSALGTFFSELGRKPDTITAHSANYYVYLDDKQTLKIDTDVIKTGSWINLTGSKKLPKGYDKHMKFYFCKETYSDFFKKK